MPVANLPTGANIAYETTGSGFPVLLFAPGGMRSAMSFWETAEWNPVTALSDQFTVVAMDQRNAGASTAPITAADGWPTQYAPTSFAQLKPVCLPGLQLRSWMTGLPIDLKGPVTLSESATQIRF